MPGKISSVDFTYDDRDRLIREVRTLSGSTSTTVYDLTYTYDQLGNRKTKTDAADANAVKMTEYYYDTLAANRNPAYPTNNNRLMWYTEKVSDGQGGWSLQRTVYYTYTRNGDATNITIKDENVGGAGVSPAERRDLALTYTRNGRLWLAVWDQWTVNPSYAPTWPGDPCGDVANGAVQSGTYVKTAAREFRYDGGRARYMARDVEPNDDNQNGIAFEPLAGVAQSWTEYGGDLPYEDHNVNVSAGSATFAPQTAYLGTAATLDENTGAKAYLHEDLIGSNNFASDAAGNAGTAAAYSAFGDVVGGYSAMAGRYGYAGSWGYEGGLLSLGGANGSLAPLSLEHVGERWYQAAIGRFVQRDPIGIRGGPNTYSYTGSEPTKHVDPHGLDRWPNWVGLHQGMIVGPIGGVYYSVNYKATIDANSPVSTVVTGTATVALGATLGTFGKVVIEETARPSGSPDVVSTPSQDAALLHEVANSGYYYHALFHNCIWFTKYHLYDGGAPRPTVACQRYFCLVEGTTVLTTEGPRFIENLSRGDCVLSASDMSPRTEQVVALRESRATEWLVLVFSEGPMSCTPEHPFWVVGKGWTPAGQIEVGQDFLTPDGAKATLLDKHECASADGVRVFDISVERTHVFFAGPARVLTHNKMMLH